MPKTLLPGEVLLQMIDEKDWSQSELARRAGRQRSVINEVIAGRRNVGRELGIDLARAFGISPDLLFQKLGLFPSDPDTDHLTEEGIHILRQLEGEDKEEALRYLRLRKQVVEERGKYNVRKNKTRPATSG